MFADNIVSVASDMIQRNNESIGGERMFLRNVSALKIRKVMVGLIISPIFLSKGIFHQNNP